MNTSNQPLRVLIVEDSENDALLVELELQRAGYEARCRRVDTPAAMSQELERQSWDLIVADYVMPRFNGLAALALVKELGLDVPFIVVSGHITDATAVAAMKAGAHDYLMKDNLTRLGAAVQRELREAQVRGQRRRTEERVKAQHTITRILAGAESLAEAAPNILQVLLESLQLDAGEFWIPDAGRERLELWSWRLRRPSASLEAYVTARRAQRWAPGAGLPGKSWAEHRPILLSNLGQRTEFLQHEVAAQAGLCSAVAFPVESSGSFFGALELLGTREVELDLGLANMLTAVGSEIGQFAQRRSAEEALRRFAAELELRVEARTAELAAANAKLQTAILERQRLEQELLEITEKERRRIGLDLHDDLGQKLSGVALMTKGLELKLAKEKNEAAAEAGRIHDLVQEAMDHASDLAHDLATLDFKDKDLPAALEDLATHTAQLFEISCRFKTQGTVPSLPPPVIGQLYKITQEAVTNAIKHGKAKRIGINLAEEGDDKLILTIQNNGQPFPDLQSRSTGMGLRIMNYRANLIGASLDVKAVGDHGTIVTCLLPVEADK